MRLSDFRNKITLQGLASTCFMFLAVGEGLTAETIVKLANKNAFLETFLDGPRPQASRGTGSYVGANIVGLRVGSLSELFDPEAVHLVLDASPPRQAEMCAKLFSRDGRYRAIGHYILDNSLNPTSKLEFDSKYSKILATYKIENMSIIGILGNSCDDSKADTFYVIHGSAAKAGDRQLIVQIQAGDARIRAQLGRENKPVGPAVLCSAVPNGLTVAFTHECKISLATGLLPGKYQLSIAETTSSGDMLDKVYYIILPTQILDR